MCKNGWQIVQSVEAIAALWQRSPIVCTREGHWRRHRANRGRFDEWRSAPTARNLPEMSGTAAGRAVGMDKSSPTLVAGEVRV